MFRAAVLALLALLYSANASAVIEIEIDLTSDVTYMNSMAVARTRIGELFTNIQTLIDDEPLRQIYRTPSVGHRQIARASIVGMDLPPQSTMRVEFLLDTNSLYVIGFMLTDPNGAGAANAFVFPDSANDLGPVPGATDTFKLTNDSNYNRLVRVAGVTREDLVFSRPSISASYLALGAHEGASLTATSAAAILRFATIISEAMRFGGIERQFASNVLRDYLDWRMSAAAIEMTLNWQNLSADIHAINASSTAVTERTEARAGVVRARGPRQLTLAASMVKFCDGVTARTDLRRSLWSFLFGGEDVVPRPANLDACPEVKTIGGDEVYMDISTYIHEVEV